MPLTRKEEREVFQRLEEEKREVIYLLRKVIPQSQLEAITEQQMKERKKRGGRGKSLIEEQAEVLKKFWQNKADDGEILLIPLCLLEKLIPENMNGEIKKQLEIAFQLRNFIVEKNKGLIYKLAVSKKGKLEFEDLVQEGNIGLIIATEKFDYRQGHKFSTYARWWIWQTIERAKMKKGTTVKRACRIYEKYSLLQKEKKVLRQEMDREPSLEELAESIQTEKEEIEKLVTWMEPEYSLDAPLYEDETWHYVYTDSKADPAQEAITKIAKEQLALILEKLNPREQIVIKKRFGLNGEELCLSEIGKLLGVSRERVRQIEKEALQKLRHPKVAPTLHELWQDAR